MNIDEAFPSNWLASSDFPQPIQLNMSQVTIETLGQGKDAEQKPVLYFQGYQKGMVLNKTNKNVIKDQYGGETQSWTGKPIWVFSMMVESFGKMQLGIRVSIEQPQMMQPGPQTDQYQEMAQQQQPAPLNNPPSQGVSQAPPTQEYQAPFVDPNKPQPDPAGGVPQTYPDGSPYPGNN